jgi:hypothetical protein
MYARYYLLDSNNTVTTRNRPPFVCTHDFGHRSPGSYIRLISHFLEMQTYLPLAIDSRRVYDQRGLALGKYLMATVCLSFLLFSVCSGISVQPCVLSHCIKRASCRCSM